MHVARWVLASLLVGSWAFAAGPQVSAGGGPPQPLGNPPAGPPAAPPPAGQPPAGQPPAGNPTPGHPAQPQPTASQALATRLFDEAVRWVARGQAGIQTVKDFHVRLHAKLDLGATHSEGPMLLWLQGPDRYRQELTISNSPQVKILNQGRLWIAGANGKFVDMLRTPDGASALDQAREDRARLVDITTFLTLEGLKGPDVTFESEGEKGVVGVPPATGTWWKIVRKARGRPNVHFWLAYHKDAAGIVHATYPAVVRVDGDPRDGTPTEDYLLQRWEDQPGDPPRPFRFPRKILAFQSRPGQPPVGFLTAIVEDIRINATIDPSHFYPPGISPPPPPAGQPR